MTTVEVITSVERRRRWSREEKLRIVAESAQPGSDGLAGCARARHCARPAFHLAASVAGGGDWELRRRRAASCRSGSPRDACGG